MTTLKILSLVGAIALTGCVTNPPYQNHSYQQPNQQNYRNNTYSQPQQVRYGKIQNIRQIPIAQNSTSGVGIGIGAVAGGLLGNQIGSGGGRAAATVIGAIGGGALGNEVERRRGNNQAPGLEIEVRLDNSREVVTVVQADQGQNFRHGSRVRLVQENGQWFVTY